MKGAAHASPKEKGSPLAASTFFICGAPSDSIARYGHQNEKRTRHYGKVLEIPGELRKAQTPH
jgi:hypothetical protein